jgi:hypothetical protein
MPSMHRRHADTVFSTPAIMEDNDGNRKFDEIVESREAAAPIFCLVSFGHSARKAAAYPESECAGDCPFIGHYPIFRWKIFMELHQIRYSLALAKALNFTRAAEDYNVSQPSLSMATSQLAGKLGSEFFRRERSLTHLTEFGQMVLPELRKSMVPRGGIEPPTRGFSVRCSTN